MEFGVALIFLGIVVLIVLLAIASAKARERRLQEIAELAGRLGFQMIASEPGGCLTLGVGGSARDPLGLIQKLEPFDPFGQGLDRTIDILIYGERDGRHWYLFDYSYVTESSSTDSEGKRTTSRTTHHYSIVVARVAMLLPEMRIRGQGFFDNIGAMFGLRDLQFESEEFNKRFHITCRDERRAYDIIHPGMMEFMLACPPQDVQMSGMYLVLSREGEASAHELDLLMQYLEQMLNRIPEYVQEDLSFIPTWRGAAD